MNAPVPGPNSTICCAVLKSIGASIALARSGLLGSIAPVCLGLSMNSLMKFIIFWGKRPKFLNVVIGEYALWACSLMDRTQGFGQQLL